MKELTEKQLQVLQYIRAFSEANACPPTVREIATHFEVSLKAAQDHITALRKKKCLSPGEKRSRSLRILVDVEHDGSVVSPPSVVSVPVLGNTAAGKPLMSEECFSGFVHVPENMLRFGKKYFALHVHGDSMMLAGILDGDTAVIEQCETAENGQIVVASIDNAVTLKRFFKEPSRVRLQPENPDYNPIYTQDVRVLGRLAAVFRKY